MNLPMNACPKCGYRSDEATSVTNPNATPQPGTWSVCFRCGHIMRFTDALTLRTAEQGEIDALDPENRALLLLVSKECPMHYALAHAAEELK